MIANQERLELVLQATDKASAQLQAVRKEIELARGSTDGTARSSMLVAQNQEKVGNQARRSAAAMSSIAFAAQNATLGTRGAVMAAGNLASAAAVGSARMAMWSPHIAAAVIVAGTLFTIFQKMNREVTGISEASKNMLSSFEDSAIDAVFQKAREQREAATIAAANSKPRSAKEVVEGTPEQRALQAAIEWEIEVGRRRRDIRLANTRKLRADATEEAKRQEKEAEEQRKEALEFQGRTLIELRERRHLAAMQVGGASDVDIALHRIEQQSAAEIRALDKYKLAAGERLELEYRIREVHNEQFKILASQAGAANRRTHAGMEAESEDPREAFQGRMELIRLERDARIAAGIDVATADAIAERQRRALRLETARAAIGYLKQIEDATLGSSNKQIRAIGMLANTVRRLHIGAEASLAAVESARAFGKVPGYLASHQYGSAALSALAGLKLAAAAALGFRESLGGGGGGGAGSGGGGGSASEASRFEPSAGSSGAGSGITINLITRDPYGRESIQQTLYSLERAGVLKTPAIQIPPTTGIRAA
ncbi:MAG: hypothetical protein WEA80_01880 [Gemmatimonadaceae bacterium]